ncbi:MAG: serine/threonine protein kinase [Planctomycetes bacterium]|nr:serine/threonine protein kinase [Planctomycetota bacterium]
MPNLNPEIEGFTIIKRLGVGARTTIYLATDLATKQQIALKQIVLENPEDTRIFEQIDTEYKVSQLLDHPYLRKCYKLIKRRKMLKVNEVLLTMEMFQGQSLEDGPSLSLGDVLLVFRMVATALNAMHQKGYVHCDIKPNNIMFGHDGTIKIIDFGQSCKIGAIKKRIQGTPDYIAPEQVRREHLSHRTDIFNLGATMYWALTGKNVPTLIPKKNEFGIPVVQKECKTPHEIYSKIPMSVSELVMECVREKQVERPENMAAVTARLDVLIRKIFENKLVNNGK